MQNSSILACACLLCAVVCIACENNTAILAARGEFCNNSGDCQPGLVCKGNLCSKPDEPPLDGDNDRDGEVENEQELIEQIDAEDADQREQEEYNHPLLMPGEKRLSTIGLADGLDPADINGDYVVWCHGASGRLFVHCISENWTDELTVDGVNHLCWWASVSNGKVVTLATKPEGELSYAIEAYEIDIQSRDATPLRFSAEESFLTQVSARGNYIAWQHSYDGGLQIGLYDLITKGYKILTNESLTHKTPRLSESHVVWSQLNSAQAGSDIWLYDLHTGFKRKISENTYSDYTYRIDASVDNGYVAWNNVNELADEYHVWLYDISGGKSHMLETEGRAGTPWIEQNYVYFEEEVSTGQYRIRAMNINTREYTWITDLTWAGSQGMPKVSERWMIYYEYNRFEAPDGFSRGEDVVLFDLCTLDHFKNEDICR